MHARQELERFNRDITYFQAHQQELLAQYPECWVAIYNQQVVGTSPHFDQLLEELRKVGVPPERVFVEYLTQTQELLILPG